MIKKLIHIEGMGCQNCVKHVHEALTNLESVIEAEVSLEKNSALITLSGDIDDSEIINAIDEASYDVTKIEAA